MTDALVVFRQISVDEHDVANRRSYARWVAAP
jgi:hypothetical protein